MSKSTASVAMIGVLLVAVALRLWGLDARGLWQDEIFTAAIAAPENTLVEVASIPLYNTALPAPPLYFLVTHFLLRLGDNDFLLRFPALVFGVLGVAVAYPLGIRLLGRAEGLLGAFLLALAPFHVRYSQDARFYTLLAFLSLLSVYALWRAMAKGERACFLLFGISTVANLYNQLFAFLVLGAELIFVAGLWAAKLARPRPSGRGSGEGPMDSSMELGRRSILAFTATLAIVALAYTPMLPHLWRGLSGSKGLAGGVTGWSLDPAPLLQAVDSWSLGSGWRILILLVPFLFGVIASARTARRALWLLCCWIVVPFAALLVLRAGHGFRPRYVLFMLPFYLLFAARGLTALAGLAGRRLLKGRAVVRPGVVTGLSMVLVFLSILPLRAYYEEDRANWRAVSSLVSSQIGPEDVIVSPGPFPQVVMPRYESDLAGATFVIGGSEIFADRADGKGAGVWFVGPAREKMETTYQQLTESAGLFFKVVFEVDDQSAARGRSLKVAPVMYDDLWVLYVGEGLEPGDVEERYRRALEVVPPTVGPSVHVSLGDLLRSQDELDQAIAQYQEAATLDPNTPEPHYGLAMAYEAQGLQELYETEWRIYEELSAR